MIKEHKIVNSFEELPSPSYVCEVELLEKNLKLLKYVQDEANIKILLALKGFAMFSTFDICREYLEGCCASGLHEAILAKEEFKKEVHTYSPAFKDEEIDEIISISNHLVFNSFSQLRRFKDKAYGKASLGIRLNPEYSSVEVDLYNPCAPFSRMGTTKANFDESMLEYLEGFHFHALCEQNVDALQGALKSFEEKFSQYFSKLKWVNFGGGHHITRADYDVEGLIKLLKDFKARYPHLEVYMEPGEAIGWQTGYLVATVLDIIDNGMNLVILDTSAEAHMPDTLAMPYRAMIRDSGVANEKKYTYRLGGNTCLSGDIIGDYSFDKPLQVGDKIILEDMIHYTMVKTTTFNGIKLPSIVIKNKDNSYKVVKDFGYNDYKSKLS
ncbi:carboxynorspermidine decarboxylase [Aliarcobacter trophiarum LMG 25534]|uniref:Carboxynorspermidine/carboxyspermidine decarboxylase n=1 Tax=Aliarcobacter trophiarum LMG 25534 TaxID=1032241 RepID=A0AAD0QK76_9BACT|nr:carboxynorspermidine decarboxylase [Aliarcobacter trophiarum]AXK48455.1 carboxynorspermidine decarboxylase [Aliarcobacter trophiarum LMG 25534]RXI28021.1 carboxynorspermidine decarboxylase [Aliarcobacter trophiarum]RXJ89570.1 carboxynorspermidine decarboxylase [Aliarcobacter trophiarum LMG 25534]